MECLLLQKNIFNFFILYLKIENVKAINIDKQLNDQLYVTQNKYSWLKFIKTWPSTDFSSSYK